MCDNCRRALHELEIQWGNQALDLAKIRQILNHHDDAEVA